MGKQAERISDINERIERRRQRRQGFLLAPIAVAAVFIFALALVGLFTPTF